MTSRPSAPPLQKPPHPAVAARAVSDAAHVAAYIWARPLDPARHGRAVSQLYSMVFYHLAARLSLTPPPGHTIKLGIPGYYSSG